MLSKLIVNVYGWLIEIFLWVAILGSAVIGYNMPVPLIKGAGVIVANEMVWRVYAAIFMPAITFLVLAVAMGPLLLLVDIRKSVRALEASSQGSGGGSIVLPVDYKEPHL